MNQLKPPQDIGKRSSRTIQKPLPHDSAAKQVTGEALYIDDLPEPGNLLHTALGLSDRVHAELIQIDISEALEMPGVVTILTSEDIPGVNDFGIMATDDDFVFAEGKVNYHGQVIFAVLAENELIARKAVNKVKVSYRDLPPVLSNEQAIEKNQLLQPPMTVAQGDSENALAKAPNRLSGRYLTGAQEHFYLEGQISVATPKEDGDMHIHCSTQAPTAVQHRVAAILDKPANAVTVEVRRMGGGFGGKETLATLFAAIAALGARKTGRPVKCRPDRDVDMTVTGKRHEVTTDYQVGFDDDGRILGLEMDIYVRCGVSVDQSIQVIQRLIMHCDNCYYLENARFTAYPCRTNTVSACAFRGFGTPQGMAAIERVIDHIAFELDKDPLAVRRLNLYGKEDRNITPYDAVIKDNIIPELLEELVEKSDYLERRKSIGEFNAKNPSIKKGIALTPIKYGAGLTKAAVCQAGALIHIYKDGSIYLNHGGTEMGQGLFIKVAQVVAQILQVDIDRIKISATATDKVPNTTATAASSGTDLNGMAALDAARKLRHRLTRFASEKYGVTEDEIDFKANKVFVGDLELPFEKLVFEAYQARVPLSATGFFKTEERHFDFNSNKGDAYWYYAYGAAVAETAIDLLTGENKVLRVDILHDVGQSLNTAVDYGQLEGGFIQGMGWLTSEEVYWDDAGVMQTHAPSTYKIPACSDVPKIFNREFTHWSDNRSPDALFKSKAIGEPPFTLALAVISSLNDAVAAADDYRTFPQLNAPATPERILTTLAQLSK